MVGRKHKITRKKSKYHHHRGHIPKEQKLPNISNNKIEPHHLIHGMPADVFCAGIKLFIGAPSNYFDDDESHVRSLRRIYRESTKESDLDYCPIPGLEQVYYEEKKKK